MNLTTLYIKIPMMEGATPGCCEYGPPLEAFALAEINDKSLAV